MTQTHVAFDMCSRSIWPPMRDKICQFPDPIFIRQSFFVNDSKYAAHGIYLLAILRFAEKTAVFYRKRRIMVWSWRSLLRDVTTAPLPLLNTPTQHIKPQLSADRYTPALNIRCSSCRGSSWLSTGRTRNPLTQP